MSNKLFFISFNHSIAYIFNPKTGITDSLNLRNITNIITNNEVIVCNKLLLKGIISKNILEEKVKDILYLYALIFPTKFTTNSIKGLSKALNLYFPCNLKEEAGGLYKIYNTLIDNLLKFDIKKQKNILAISNFMTKDSTWNFHTEINSTLKKIKLEKKSYLKIWKNFNNVETNSKSNLINNYNSINKDLVIDTLMNLTKNHKIERKNQKEYAIGISQIFLNNNTSISKEDINKVNPKLKFKTRIAFAEAGTGVGKTIGYLAATVSFIRNNPNAKVVISTYSKTLQQQIIKELIKHNELPVKFTTIKGNHNYICLLNVKHFLDYDKNNSKKVALGFILRWLQETETGDLLGDDFLSWLKDVIPKDIINNLLNRRDECLYTKCNYYKKCFITKIKERVKDSNIIISNHSLTLLNNFSAEYFIFDEAHALYNVSDEAYCKEISANKGIFLRNWILGNNTKFRKDNTLNGFQSRVNNILAFIEKNNKSVEEANHKDKSKVNLKDNSEQEVIDLKIRKLLNTLNFSINFFPSNNYLLNIEQHNPQGAFEEFLYYIYNHVLLHNDDLNQYYSLESYPINLSQELKEAAKRLVFKLNDVLQIANALKGEFINKLKFIDKANKSVLIELINSFEYNCITKVTDFINLLNELDNKEENYIYYFSIIKEEYDTCNIGYYKHYINPLQAFSEAFIKDKRGIAFTSATLLDNEVIDRRKYLIKKFGLEEEKIELVSNINLTSPFDYVKNSKVIILNSNYSKNYALRQEALLQLFLAARGGVLTIFTSLARLREHYNSFINNILLKEKGIDVLANINKNKHTSSLLDLFKENEHSCLLGSDSFRDGIDIPGRSLRMVVFEKVPWLRKNILNNTRKKFYDSNLELESIRLKLRQAFGRIIRNENDKGIFVLLDPAIPSKFLSAFPKDIEIHKVSLEEAIKLSKEFLTSYIKLEKL